MYFNYDFSEKQLREIFNTTNFNVNDHHLFKVKIVATELTEFPIHIRTLGSYVPLNRNVTVKDLIETINEGLKINIICEDDPFMYEKIFFYLQKFKFENNITDDEDFIEVENVVKEKMGDSLNELFKRYDLNFLKINNPFDTEKLDKYLLDKMAKGRTRIEYSIEEITREINSSIKKYHEKEVIRDDKSNVNSLESIDLLVDKINTNIEIDSTMMKELDDKLVPSNKKYKKQKMYDLMGRRPNESTNGIQLDYETDSSPMIIEQDII